MATHLLQGHTFGQQQEIIDWAPETPWTDSDLILVCVYGGVADRSPEAGHWAGLTGRDRSTC